ncbi:hypothetical protein ACJMK2_039356 [Sinanodonta woodiana]|uniref:Nicotinamide N-methyltransferase-like n=1 Tax=Sinanodonta woodiana TaxID=1069815 RepID=A0ABD3WBR8_SINWO
MSDEPVLTTHRDVAFDPETYVTMYYSRVTCEEGDMLTFFLDCLKNAFKSGEISGMKLLDIGTGPVLHTAFCAAPWFEEITLSDFDQNNLDFLQKWKDGKISHMGPVFAYLSETNEKGMEVDKRQDELRRKIQHIVHSDVTLPNPLVSTPVDGVVFDAITSSLCLEAASITIEDYVKTVRNLSSLLKPGGHLVITGVLEETFYRIGDVRFKCTYISKDQVQDIYQKEGFEIVRLKDLKETCSSPKYLGEYSDYQNAYVMIAKKVQQ